MKSIFSLFGIALIVLTVNACGDHYMVHEGSSAPVRIRDDNLPGTQIRWNNVSLLDKSIENKILVEGTNSRRTATNTLEVWALFRNRTDYPLQIEARASFFDASQAPLEGPTAWQRVVLPPNANGHYKEFSTRVNIGFYTIEVREGR
jgi:hypothetical protein